MSKLPVFDIDSVLVVRCMSAAVAILFFGVSWGQGYDVSPTKPYSGKPISLSYADITMQDFARVLGTAVDTPVVASDKIAGEMTVKVSDVPWDELLARVLQANHLVATNVNGTIFISWPSGESEGEDWVSITRAANMDVFYNANHHWRFGDTVETNLLFNLHRADEYGTHSVDAQMEFNCRERAHSIIGEGTNMLMLDRFSGPNLTGGLQDLGDHHDDIATKIDELIDREGEILGAVCKDYLLMLNYEEK